MHIIRCIFCINIIVWILSVHGCQNIVISGVVKIVLLHGGGQVVRNLRQIALNNNGIAVQIAESPELHELFGG